MIKTHKPRGHFWTNASAFQQTVEYRNVKYEELIPRSNEVLVRDEDDFLSTSKRAAKRRRIEKLADEFLNGKSLFISSARPCPQALKSTISWNKRSSGDPKFVLPTADVSEDEPIWEDVENNADILDRLTLSHCLNRTQNYGELNSEPDHGTDSQNVADSTAQANIGRPRANAIKINMGPSEEALKQAAALRARRTQRVGSEMPVGRHSSDVKRIVQIVNEPRSEPPNETLEQRSELSKDWLSRRRSRFSFSNYNADEDSVDDLHHSRIETPFASLDKQSEFEESHYASSSQSRIESETSGVAAQASAEHIAQRKHFGSQGINAICTPTWTAINGPAPTADRGVTRAANATPADHTEIFQEPTLQKSTVFNTRKSTNSKEPVRNYPRQQSGNTRQTRSTTATSGSAFGEQRSNANSQRSARVSKAQPRKRAYKSVEATDNGSTPFMFRKGLLNTQEDDTIPGMAQRREQRKGRRSANDTSSHTSEVPLRTPYDPGTSSLAQPPLLEMSFGHDSSFAPNLNMALVDEHLNAVLPAAAASDTNTSAVKKAIRRELRTSGAEVTRCGGEPPPSSQVAEQPSPDDAISHDDESSIAGVACEESVIAGKQSGPSQFWPGTQLLLEKAQKELLTSPEKQQPHDLQGGSDDAGRPEPISRGSPGPPRRLSQEPTPGPSTQAMLADFKGFSTVKKHRSRYGEPLNPTPTASGKHNRVKQHDIASPLSASAISSNRISPNTSHVSRRSSLRFAESVDQPQPDTTNIDTVNSTRTPGEMPATNRLYTNTATPASILRSSQRQTPATRKSEVELNSQMGSECFDQDMTMASFESGLLVSSYQAAQPRSMLLREDSELNRTIDELTSNLLDVNELNGVLSQVSQ